MLSRHSFNALLKTLEERSNIKFLLAATTDPQKLPVIILFSLFTLILAADENSNFPVSAHILTCENIPLKSHRLVKLQKRCAEVFVIV